MRSRTDDDSQTDGRAIGGAAATDLAASGRRLPARRLLREPLLHFLVVGIVVVGAYRILAPDQPTREDARRIEITEDDLRQLAVAWLAQGRRVPTPAQMRALVDQKIDSEVLFREAIALGLDKDDEIIKRRLAQKMDFLVADVAAMAPPTAGQLEAWFEQNSERFALPPRVSFRHLYFSPDRRGEGARDEAAASLVRISGLPPDAAEVAAGADRFMFRSYYASNTPEQVARDFGPDFSAGLFQLESGSWQGPIESGYGWHLVWIDSLESSRVPAYEEVKPEVVDAWQQERYLEVKERAIAEMRSRYTIVVPPLDDIDAVDMAIPNPSSTGAPGE